jgi:hypothetical protein
VFWGGSCHGVWIVHVPREVTRRVGVRHSEDRPTDWDMGPLAELRATRNSCRECLTLREKPASRKEGDAFLARLRMRDILLLMEDGPYSACALGMRHPYGQVLRDGARSMSGTLWACSAPKGVPKVADVPTRGPRLTPYFRQCIILPIRYRSAMTESSAGSLSPESCGCCDAATDPLERHSRAAGSNGTSRSGGALPSMMTATADAG